MQSISSKIWTRVAEYDDNHYTTGTSTTFLLYGIWLFLSKIRSLKSPMYITMN